VDEAIAALSNHVANFPESPTGPRLFERLVDQLVSDRRTPEVKRCCQAALRQFGGEPEASLFKRVLLRIARDERSQQRRVAYVEQIKAKLGGHDDGYFVIFVHRPVITEGSPVDYHVSEGLDKAIAYIGALNKSMVWELSGWFPRTPEGREQARVLCNKLIEKNTYPIYKPSLRHY
jgi:hypothetical protein